MRDLRMAMLLKLSLVVLLLSNCLGGEDKSGFDYQRVELANGLEVITLEDFSCPIVVSPL